ncbi:sulfotransferase [Nocardioides sp. TF02-7]|uniref:sulfotransferase n=1 Tax=Nocardioides sp. TF02-7 TaxID=2917724 RepID=UPI001F059099|nr:sulfotransferase [Nocardioides sp. TF02-7]UMG91129.1 sulfotransferase domain-containing protein [Nocardioides sp. TF02-7]
MTTLSRSSVEPDLMTVQCDVCFPPARRHHHPGRADRARLAAAGQRRRRRHVPPLPVRTAPGAGAARRPGRRRHRRWAPAELLHHRRREGRHHQPLPLPRPAPRRVHGRGQGAALLLRPRLREVAAALPRAVPGRRTGAGEASTLYTRSPAIPGVPERMAALVPDARLVYLVRDPVERALASWREERFHVTERRPAEEAFQNPEDPHNAYVAGSRYADQLQGYLDHFPAEQVLVLDQRELATDAATVVARVVDFLGLDQHPVDTGTRHNEGGTKFEYGALGHRLRFSAPARAVRRMPVPVRRALTAPARRFLRQQVPKPELAPELMTRLQATLRPDAERLRAMTGLELAHWSV